MWMISPCNKKTDRTTFRRQLQVTHKADFRFPLWYSCLALPRRHQSRRCSYPHTECANKKAIKEFRRQNSGLVSNQFPVLSKASSGGVTNCQVNENCHLSPLFPDKQLKTSHQKRQEVFCAASICNIYHVRRIFNRSRIKFLCNMAWFLGGWAKL